MEAQRASEAVEVQIQLTWRDYARWNLWHRFRGVYTRVVLAISLPLFCLFLLATFGASDGNQRFVPLFLAIVILLSWVVTPLSILLGARRALASYEALKGPVRFVFSREGVAVESPLSSGRTNWDAYWRACESGDAFYLYVANCMANIIPKRFFRDENEIKRFQEIVKAGIGPTKCKFRRS